MISLGRCVKEYLATPEGSVAVVANNWSPFGKVTRMWRIVSGLEVILTTCRVPGATEDLSVALHGKGTGVAVGVAVGVTGLEVGVDVGVAVGVATGGPPARCKVMVPSPR